MEINILEESNKLHQKVKNFINHLFDNQRLIVEDCCQLVDLADSMKRVGLDRAADEIAMLAVEIKKAIEEVSKQYAIDIN